MHKLWWSLHWPEALSLNLPDEPSQCLQLRKQWQVLLAAKGKHSVHFRWCQKQQKPTKNIKKYQKKTNKVPTNLKMKTTEQTMTSVVRFKWRKNYFLASPVEPNILGICWYIIGYIGQYIIGWYFIGWYIPKYTGYLLIYRAKYIEYIGHLLIYHHVWQPLHFFHRPISG